MIASKRLWWALAALAVVILYGAFRFPWKIDFRWIGR